MGLDFSITQSDIKIPEFCPVLGIKLATIGSPSFGKRQGAGRNGGGAPCPNAPSLDRVKPELGYVKGNVIVMSWRANSLKKDATLLELQQLVAFMQDR